MKVRIWGSRGSIPTPLTNFQVWNKIEKALRLGMKANLDSVSDVHSFMHRLPWYVAHTAGGDTTCVEVQGMDEVIILDAGTGIRPLGLDLLKRNRRRPLHAHILISHTHWDHISGFPFFNPAFIPGNKITFYGAFDDLEQRFKDQQKTQFFPISLDMMAADIRFVQIEEKAEFNIGNAEIRSFPLNHPGGCSGYRISSNGRSMVYATDAEYKNLTPEGMKPYIEFYRDADLLIFDAQYTLIESVEKEDWGHSTAFIGIEMAFEADVRNLVLTHHEPTYDDEQLWIIYLKAIDYLKLHHSAKKMNLHLAYEGMSIEL